MNEGVFVISELLPELQYPPYPVSTTTLKCMIPFYISRQNDWVLPTYIFKYLVTCKFYTYPFTPPRVIPFTKNF